MNDMNAKDILLGKHQGINEAHEPGDGGALPPPGRQYPEMPPERFGRGPRDRRERGNPDVHRAMGDEPSPRGQFSPRELDSLKDVLLLIYASTLNSEMDKAIVDAVINGTEIDKSNLQHILDEANNASVPASYHPLLQKIFSQLQ